jgi:hypothetical protein
MTLASADREYMASLRAVIPYCFFRRIARCRGVLDNSHIRLVHHASVGRIVILAAEQKKLLALFFGLFDSQVEPSLHLVLEAHGVSTLCGIWANRKSFLLAPRRHAKQSGK